MLAHINKIQIKYAILFNRPSIIRNFLKNFNLKKISAVDSKKLIPKVYAKTNMFGMPITMHKPFSQKNACSTLTYGNCPLRRGDTARYYFTMPVESLVGGGLEANVEVSLVNERKKSVGCLALPVKIYYPNERKRYY